MGFQMNFNNIDEATNPEGSGLRLLGSLPLARQSSVYSLTFDEIQNTLGGVGKDLGSMNIDELLKSIWNAEETPSTVAASVGRSGGSAAGTNLLRQDSLTLPPTLSQKTVDEVWRDLTRDGGSGTGTGGSSVPQGQQTLGEMTLEEFLARAGVVKEDFPLTGMADDSSLFVPGSNTGISLGFQQISKNGNLMSTNTSTMNHPACVATNTPGVKSSVPQLSQQHPFSPKQTTVYFAPQMNLVKSSQIPNPGAAKHSMVRTKNPTMNNNMAQSARVHSGAIVTAALASQVPLHMVTKNKVEDSSLFPVPFAFSQGRKSGTSFEKVVERRQRRMIKNRESAARSRDRKQAYTLELEAEISKLKEINGDLERKQAQMMEMQKIEILEKLDRPEGGKRLCLRRTLTGPW